MVTKEAVTLRDVRVPLDGTSIAVVGRVNRLDARTLRRAGHAIDARPDAPLADLRHAIGYVAVLAWHTSRGTHVSDAVVSRASATLAGVR